MTYETLIRFKKIYEDNNDQENLKKVLRALKNYPQSEEPPIEPPIEENKKGKK